MSDTVVVNLYKEPYDVYIGRPGKGQDGYFGNPHRTGSREDSIKLFRKYFQERLKNDPEYRRRIHDLKGKRLGCFCKPQACHGDIIAAYLNSINIEPIVAAVIGSRDFDDYQFLLSILKWFEIKKIVSGGARGADSLAERYARDHAIDLEVIEAEWDRYGRSAGIKRNIKVIDRSQEVIAFWDGKSPGTKHAITYADSQGKPVHIFRPPTPKVESSIPHDDISNLG